jgi:gamma-glutamylcyclotransferase (GGCT)/AIG2-like uncharacterized protein YtfP
MIYVFVYGTLKPGECNYERYCGAYGAIATPARVQGRLYDLGVGYPAMTLEDGWVQGYRLEFADAAALDHLDQLEGYCSDRPADENDYQRLLRPVWQLLTAAAPQSLGQAWVYVMTSPQLARYDARRWLESGIWHGKL